MDIVKKKRLKVKAKVKIKYVCKCVTQFDVQIHYKSSKAESSIMHKWNSMLPMRLHHSKDGSTFPGYKLMCFLYIDWIFGKEQNTLAYDRGTWWFTDNTSPLSFTIEGDTEKVYTFCTSPLYTFFMITVRLHNFLL